MAAEAVAPLDVGEPATTAAGEDEAWRTWHMIDATKFLGNPEGGNEGENR